MQVTFSEDQVKIVKGIFDYLIWPSAGLIFHSVYKRAIKLLNTIITENVNRIQAELVIHINKKFKEHEDSAFSRITQLEKVVNEWNNKLIA